MARLTVAAVQFELRAERNLDGYVEHVDRLVGRAADAGAELVVFPELASTGLLGSITSHEVTRASIASDYWNVLPRLTDGIVDAAVASAR
jgi:predicted amidohydrolase